MQMKGGSLLKLRIECNYQTKQGSEASFYSDERDPRVVLDLAEDLQQTGRMKELTILDEYDTTWTIKELKKFLEEVKTEPHDITVYFDGGFDRATQEAGLGCVIYYHQNDKVYRIRKNALVEGLVSNNEAEYAALHLGLKELDLLEVRHLPITFAGDSKVVINQLKDEWPCYDAELIRWMDRIEAKLEANGMTPIYKEISRKANREADQLATQALEGIEITSHKEQEV